MAIDTAEKRRSAAAIQYILPSVTPNIGKDAEWRVQAAWGYFFLAALVFHVDNSIHAIFRDKRVLSEFRDKRTAAEYRDKIINAEFEDKTIQATYRDKRIGES